MKTAVHMLLAMAAATCAAANTPPRRRLQEDGICRYENDGVCDVPLYCDEGTDLDDCSSLEGLLGSGIDQSQQMLEFTKHLAEEGFCEAGGEAAADEAGAKEAGDGIGFHNPLCDYARKAVEGICCDVRPRCASPHLPQLRIAPKPWPRG